MKNKPRFQEIFRNHSLTIDGKRKIIEEKLAELGEERLLLWLKSKDIPTVRYIFEHVRKYKTKFFIDLLNLKK